MNDTQSNSDEKASLAFHVAWNGRKVAKLVDHGSTWSFNYDTGWMLPLSGGHFEDEGQIPSFLVNLLPESENGRAERMVPMGEVLQKSERYLSNIVITRDEARIGAVVADRLEGRLEEHSTDSVFCGAFSGMPSIDGNMLNDLAKLSYQHGAPRLSGCQTKLPCHLDESGVIAPAGDKPFTHILKLPGMANDSRQVRGAVEWMSMTLAKAGGVPTADFALIELPGGALGYVTERFDVPVGQADDRLLFCEDFCAAMGMTPTGKFFGTVEGMIDTLQRLSTQPEVDSLNFFKLVYANKLLENGDFHLKNAALLRQAKPTLDGFSSTVLAPAYDIMNTVFFNPKAGPNARAETMALDFQGTNNYTAKHFHSIGRMLGLSAEAIPDIMHGVATGIANKSREIVANLPPTLEANLDALATVVKGCQRALHFCHQDFPDIEPSLALASAAKSVRP